MNGASRPLRCRRALALAGLSAGLLLVFVVPSTLHEAGAAGDVAGSQGIVTSLPSTSSAATVSGTGAWAGLKVTVNQTNNLLDQAVSVSWTGGVPTTSDHYFLADYLQIFECWGDPESTDPSDPADPGPLPTQCQFGAESPTDSAYPVNGTGHEYSRVLSEPSWSSYNPSQGWKDPGTGYVVEPFDAVNGTVVDQQANYNYDNNPNDPQPFWLEPYFRFGTSNEVDFARTEQNGTGTQLFQVETGLEAPGLGCGQSVQPLPGEGTKVPQCWIVVVPRSTPDQENPAGLTGSSVVTSPLTPTAWAHRIAIPISFNPIGTSCAVNAQAQQILGSELASAAISSWEPSLCALPGSPSYSYIQNTDDQARRNLFQPTYGSAGMSVYSLPPPAGEASSSGPVVYAPLTLSGVVVAFNIERVPALVDGDYRPDEVALNGDQVLHVYLTPRLVAKLLTQSYQAQFQDLAVSKAPGYGWVQHNPTDLLTDPDFLQWNPEFADLQTDQAIDAGTAIVEEASSDSAAALWKWILADPEAAAWLDGTPDPWGMQVNPYYSTNPSINPAHTSFVAGTLDNYPKSDPYCYQNPDDVITGPPPVLARPLCMLDWAPYTLTMQAAAQATGAANDGAKTTFNPAATPNTAFGANGPQVPGTHFVITITDSASAAQDGLQTASLSRAGDDTKNRTFVAPDAASITAGEGAFVQSPTAGMLQPNPSTTAAGAYPLSMVTYGATTPESLSATQRTEYAGFIQYAAGSGQVSGSEPGQLPAGYVPLPGSLLSEDLAAIQAILHPPVANSGSTGSSGVLGTSGTTGSDIGGALTSTPTGSGESTLPSGGGSSATKARARTTPSSVVGLVRSTGYLSGLVRWALPIILAVGVGALLGAVALGRKHRPAVGTSDGGSGSGEDPPLDDLPTATKETPQ